ncbi:hypothetical protein RHMOL_Rhmol09G0117800 [Rhododendron molle]|uniref:Uncharacterized protein n=1 Tax=Rhododendron molle TaxID=49168 RepID=A0ACC0ME20_RHOML|nr:hypothetical protein RHMOL_Rhmol09G0117800 [Rhododendron molle]
MGGKSLKEATQRHFPSYSSPSFSHQLYPQSPYPQQHPNHTPRNHHAPAPYEHGGHTHRKNRKIEKKFSIISDDYDTLEQVALDKRNQMISENFYIRGDGTSAFYFSEEFLSTLFGGAGFTIVDMDIYGRQIQNRSQNITMSRCVWVEESALYPHTLMYSHIAAYVVGYEPK